MLIYQKQLTRVKHFSHPFVVDLVIIRAIIVSHRVQLSLRDARFWNQRVVEDALKLFFRNEPLAGGVTTAKLIRDFDTEAKVGSSQPG